jgi:Tfp pilus assembly pilus retraction ATPase PilT
MSLMPSLCAALERAGGQRLVMRAGERPHVLAGDRRHDVATAVLSVNAVEALVDQILSSESRRTLREHGSVEETLNTPSFPHPLTARAARHGDDFCVELIVMVPEAAPAPQVAPEPEPVATPVPEPAHVPEEIEVSVPVATSYEAAPEPVQPIAAEPEPMPPVALEPEPVQPAPEPVQPAPVAIRPHIENTTAAPVRVAVESHPPMRVVARVEERHVASRPASVDSNDLHGLIAYAFERGATTLFIRGGAPAAARINDRVVPLSDGLVSTSVLDEVASLTRGGDGAWRSLSDGEWARDHEDFGHVTCRVFADDHGHGLVVQLRPQTSPKLLQKYIPRQVRTACEGDGVIIVSAQTDGDAELLASAVADLSGRVRGGYLISLHRRSGRSEVSGAFVSQRTVVGSDADFATAIRRASHEAPDILLIVGPQTEIVLHEAILAASTGRLVIVAVVAPTAIAALRSMLGHSGLERDAHVRRALAASFRVAVGYRNLRRVGGGRLLVQDIVTTSNDLRSLLEMGDFDGLVRAVKQGLPGSRTVDEALARATRRDQVSLREAVAHADDKQRLVALVRMRAHRGPARVASRGKLHDREVHVPIALPR